MLKYGILSNLCAKLETNWLRGWGLYGPQNFTCHLLYMRFQLCVTNEFNENSIHLNPIQARLFYCLKVQGSVFWDPLMISGSLKLAQWNFVQLKHYLMTTRIQKKSEIWPTTSKWRHYKKHRENSDLRETKQMIYHSKGNDETGELTRKIFQSRSFLPTKKY